MRTQVRTYAQVCDDEVMRALKARAAKGCEELAELLELIAEVDERGLYLPEGYSSMHAFCVGELRFSEDEAFHRIHAARTARAYPVLFDAVAEARLHLTGVQILAPYLTPENVADLLAGASYGRNSDIREMLARRFPRPELLPEIVPSVSPVPPSQHAPEHVGASVEPGQHAPEHAGEPGLHAPEHVGRATPVSADRFEIRITVDRSTYEKMRYAQELHSHRVPSGDLAQLFDKALDALIAQGEKRKFAATPRPRRGPSRPEASGRNVPAQVARAVWKRDRGQCTFVAENGHRCGERKLVEFDHIVPVARGGRATMDSMRLRCRAHNQYEAERVFGRDFMQRKREESREERSLPQDERDKDVMAALRELKVRSDVAKQALEYSRSQGGVTLEERVRDALKFLWPRNVKRVAVA